MKVLITAGGTREHIDEVRVLTNISTGKLGAQIADTFSYNKDLDKIYYICSKGSQIPERPIYDVPIEIIYADSVQQVYETMEKLVPKCDVVIHSMAISDFGFKTSNIKLKSNDPQAFIDSLRERIVVNPKIISFIKKWNPKTKLVGFKFEVDKTHDELIEIAFESLLRNECDFVVANDKKEMKDKKDHIAYIITKTKMSLNALENLIYH
jgi:phosphopantothenate-cysteine ligase